jgi:hypothetical protein
LPFSADNSHRSTANELSVAYADSEAHFEVLATPLQQPAKPGEIMAVGAPVTLAVGTVSLATLRDQEGERKQHENFSFFAIHLDDS